MTELALHILDVAENGIRAEASEIDIRVREDWKSEFLEITIEDNGKGMDPGVMKRVEDPFFTTRTTRRVGLGIPLFKQHAEMAGGSLQLISKPLRGTRIRALFGLRHPDRQPMGDLAGIVLLMAGSYSGICFRFVYQTPKGKYIFNTEEVRNTLGIDRIEGRELKEQLKGMINENLNELGAQRD